MPKQPRFDKHSNGMPGKKPPHRHSSSGLDASRNRMATTDVGGPRPTCDRVSDDQPQGRTHGDLKREKAAPDR
jgi:hypothetical protein